MPGQSHKPPLEQSQRLLRAAGGTGGRASGHARLERSQALAHQHVPMQLVQERMGLCKPSLHRTQSAGLHVPEPLLLPEYQSSLGKGGQAAHKAASQAAMHSHASEVL